MKRAFLLFISFLTGVTPVFAQKRAEKWIFGSYGAGLDFACNPPYPISGNTTYYSIEGCTSIADESGNLLFYSNGEKVWNRDHIQMPNGFDMGITPDCFGSSTQGCLIVPHPGNADLYYPFTIDCTEVGQYLEDQGFRYSIIDMSLDNGLGDVTEKAIPLFGSVCEKLAAVHHSDGESVWVLVHEYGTDAFRSYLLDENGLNLNPVISNQGVVQVMYDDLPTCWGISSKRGYMKFSPQGDKLVVVSASDCHPYIHPIQMFEFDNSNGEVLLDYTFEDPDSVRYYGATFSPDGNLLYLSNSWYGIPVLDQFDLSSENGQEVVNSKVNLYTVDEWEWLYFGGMQIGPDGKIYVGQHNPYVGVIENPNVYGTGCNFNPSAIETATCPVSTYSEYGLPNFIESYFLNTYEGTSCESFIDVDFAVSSAEIGIPTLFTDLTTSYPNVPTEYSWNFDDPDSGADNFSTLQNPSHTYLVPGEYQVTLSVVAGTSQNQENFGEPCITGTTSISIFVTGMSIGNSNLPPDYTARFVNGQLILEDITETADLRLFDTSGRLVLQHTGSMQRPIDCENLPEGIYFISLIYQGHVFEMKKVFKE